MGYQIKIPSCVYSGVGSVEDVQTILKQESAKKALVFTDKGVAGAGLLDKLLAVLEPCSVDYRVFDELKPEPAYGDVEAVVEQMNREKGDIIIAIGGGSVMDAAKLCSLLKSSDYTVKDLLGDPLLASKQLKTVMIPTTCGTGSEATCNAIVAIPEEQSKKGIERGNDTGLRDIGRADDRGTSRLHRGRYRRGRPGPCGGVLYLQESDPLKRHLRRGGRKADFPEY